MSTMRHTSGYGLASDYMVGLPHNPPAPDPVPTAPAFDRADLEAKRLACAHGPYYADAASGQTCVRCGAYHPDGWTARCLRGWVG